MFKKIIMSDEDQKKPEIPRRMSRIAWPNSKYGLYLAIIIIFGFLSSSFRSFWKPEGLLTSCPGDLSGRGGNKICQTIKTENINIPAKNILLGSII